MSKPVVTFDVIIREALQAGGKRREVATVYLGNQSIGTVYSTVILWDMCDRQVCARHRSGDLWADLRWIVDQIPLVADCDVKWVQR